MKRCAFCGGRPGLISQRKGSLRFCKRVHKSAYLQRRREQQEAEGRRRMWPLDWIAGHPWLTNPSQAATSEPAGADRPSHKA
jgi:hypothetical protein